MNTHIVFIIKKQIIRLQNYPPYINNIDKNYDMSYLINIEQKYDLFIQQNIQIFNLVNIDIEPYIDIRDSIWRQISMLKRLQLR